jgi:hypothetical protein
MTTQEEQKPKAAPPTVSNLEAFLQAVERKTANQVHRQLLRACHSSDPATDLEAELSKIISAILHET